MKETIKSKALLAVFTLPILITTFSQANEGTDGVRTDIDATDLAIVFAGEGIYKAQCAACHGINLEGEANWRVRDANGYLPAPPHDETGHTWHHADDLLFEITKYGAATVIGDDTYKSKMPPYKGILSDDEIVAVLAYIKHSWPEEQRAWQAEVNGSQLEGIKPIKKKSSVLEKLLK